MENSYRFRNLILWSILSVVSVCTLGVLFYGAWYLLGQNFSLPQQTPEITPAADRMITPSPTGTGTIGISPTVTPTLLPEPSITPSPTLMLYVVQEGENLTAIAQKFGVTVEALKQINGLQNDLIIAGQSLIIPPPEWKAESTSSPVLSPSGTMPTNEETQVSETPAPLLSDDLLYTVESGDTLAGIADKFSRPIEDLRQANGMIGDTILPGQSLYIPAVPPQPTPWVFSALNSAPYIEAYEAGRFSLHYVPGTYPEKAAEPLALLEANALTFLEDTFGRSLPDHFDVYVAGSLFAPPDRGLRGRSFSASYQNYILYDGSGSPTDQQYMFAHELTHLYMWNVFGVPSSTMLSEGAAVYIGTQLIAGSAQLPLDTFCAAHLQAGALPRVSSSLKYEGHNFDLENYYAAGCFVGYLVRTYGAESVGLVYPTSDFAAVYGKSLAVLEEDWRAWLGANVSLEGVDSAGLVSLTTEITATYERFFPIFNGSANHVNAYRELDQARIALLENSLDDARQHLEAYKSILGLN